MLTTTTFRIVREVRYVREPPRSAPRIQRRVVYDRPQPRRQVVYVDSPPQRRQGGRFGSVYSNNRRQSGGNYRRNDDPFYEPRNFLTRY